MSVSRGHRAKTGRELIVVMKPPKAAAPGAAAIAPDTSHLAPLLAQHGASIEPIKPTGPRLAGAAVSSSKPTSDVALFHHVAAKDEHLDTLRDKLAADASVETAFIKEAAQPPVVAALRLAAPGHVVSTTPDFTQRQGYLGPAPVGIDAEYAWGRRGGKGAGVKIIDCEWAWNFAHEDLATQCGGIVVGTSDGSDDAHGTAVIGTIIGNANGFGVTGIAPEATLSTACFPTDSTDKPTSTIIMQAADLLSAGDILLLEIHRPGPNYDNQPNSEFGFIPIEWWPDDFLAISYATNKGIVVVEAAGNGSQDLDDPIYSTSMPDFPASWKNPFAQGGPDSGAILVGAGNPPAGTHGRTVDTLGWNDTFVDRARCGFSNFGSRIDCQGWGWEVTTLGYGDLQPGNANAIRGDDHNTLYTDIFAGTSSASPIVTGAVACVQGALRAASRPVMTPSAIRQLLRSTGSPQQSAPNRPVTQRIGSRPDLRTILQRAIQGPKPVVPLAAAFSPQPAAPDLANRKASSFAWLGILALAAAIAVTLGLCWSGTAAGALSRTPFTAWLCNLVLVTLFFVFIGLSFEKSWIGVAVDWRQKLSLSRLQMLMWTILIVATLLVTLVWNVAHGGAGLSIPSTFWLLMGIAGVSAVGDPLILNKKPDTPPAGAPLTPPGMIAYGVVVARPLDTSVSWRDLIMGDELGNASVIDIGKVQQILLTLVAFISYAVAIGDKLFDSTAAIGNFPAMSGDFMSLLAASHAIYLSYKAVPHT